MLGLSLAVAIPFAVAAGAITATLGIVYLVAAVDAGGRVRAEPGRADRPRARDRLLVARRLAVQGGARPGAAPPTRRSRRRWRPRAGRSSSPGWPSRSGSGLLLLMPIPFIRGLGSRRLARPAGGDRRRADPSAGAAVAPRTNAGPGSRASRTRTAGGRGSRARSCAGPVLYLDRRHRRPLRRGRARALPPPHPRLGIGPSLVARGGAGLHAAPRPSRDRGRHAHADRRRCRRARCGADAARFGRRSTGSATGSPTDPEAYVIASGRKPPYVDRAGATRA